MRNPALSSTARRLTRAAFVVAAGATLTACSLIYDLSTEQCSVDADCQAAGGPFSEYVCFESLCKSPTVAGACDSNAYCMDAVESAGEPFICARTNADTRRSCIPLKSPECPVMLPVTNEAWRENLRNDDVLILGGFAPVPTTLIGTIIRNYDLALTELTTQVGGIPGSNGSRRPVVMVVCNSDLTEHAALDAMMTHLADKLKIPGVVSGLYADELQYAFESKGRAASMFFMSPLESDSTLISLLDDGLVWHVGGSAGTLAKAYAPLLDRALAKVAPSEPARVAMVVASDLRVLSDIAATVEGSPDEGGIVFNGKTSSQNSAEGNYLSLAVPSIAANPTADLSTQTQEVLAFKPHVIIADAAGEFLEKMVPGIEGGWDAAAPGQPRPFYLLSPFHYNTNKMPPVLSAFPTVRQRLVGINPPAAADTRLYDVYTRAYDTAYQEDRGARGYENFYDATYYLMYAAAGAGNLLVSGQDMKRGMTRLLSGPPFDVGKQDMSQAMVTLSLNSSITLNGTLGPPNFDPNTGGREDVGSAWCVANGGAFVADVLRYNGTDKTMDGTLPAACFTGF